MAKVKLEAKKGRVEIPIKWHISDDMISRYASNVLVQSLEHEFKISFFETKFPIRMTSQDPAPKEVRADCVASIILSPAKIPALVKALQQQYDNFITKQSIIEKPEEQTKELTD